MNTRLILILFLLLAGIAARAAENAAPPRYQFAFTLPQAAAVSSAGVYDARDHR